MIAVFTVLLLLSIKAINITTLSAVQKDHVAEEPVSMDQARSAISKGNIVGPYKDLGCYSLKKQPMTQIEENTFASPCTTFLTIIQCWRESDRSVSCLSYNLKNSKTGENITIDEDASFVKTFANEAKTTPDNLFYLGLQTHGYKVMTSQVVIIEKSTTGGKVILNAKKTTNITYQTPKKILLCDLLFQGSKAVGKCGFELFIVPCELDLTSQRVFHQTFSSIDMMPEDINIDPKVGTPEDLVGLESYYGDTIDFLFTDEKFSVKVMGRSKENYVPYYSYWVYTEIYTARYDGAYIMGPKTKDIR